MDRVKKLIDWFKEHEDKVPLCGIFFTRNIVGDSMEIILDLGDVRVEECYFWDYIEVFGLTEEEQAEFVKLMQPLVQAKHHILFDTDDDDDDK